VTGDGAVVVGGGPAGAAAALLLARARRGVTVIEREPEPAHRICGEFIGGDGLARLAALGIDVARLGARPIGRVRLVRGAAVAETALPFAAAGVCRRALDAALLEAAEAAGAAVARGHAVRRIGDGGIEVDRLGILRPAALFLATGKQELRGARRALRDAPDRKLGLKTHLRLTAAQAAELDGAVELMLFPDAYAGLQMVTRETANLCLVVAEERFALARGWQGLLAELARACPSLARRLDGARGWDRPLAIARTPYGFMHRARRHEPAFRLGDQMGVIPSFTGDGIAIALDTAALAARTHLQGGTTAEYHGAAARRLRRPIRLATALYRAGHAPLGQFGMMAAARLWPGSLRAVAAMTRVR
jgi:flavin-dependent dehydrogenase